MSRLPDTKLETVIRHAQNTTFFSFKNRTRKILEQTNAFDKLLVDKDWQATFKSKYLENCNQSCYVRRGLSDNDLANATKILLHAKDSAFSWGKNRTHKVLQEMGIIDQQGNYVLKK